MIRFVAVATGILASACSSAPPTSSADTSASKAVCGDRTGSYVVSFVERSGTCGPLSEQVFVAGGPSSGAPDPACTGGSTETADNCSVTVDLTCPARGYPGAYVSTRGTVHWANDGSIGTGILGISVTGTPPTCTSTYDATYTRK